MDESIGLQDSLKVIKAAVGGLKKEVGTIAKWHSNHAVSDKKKASKEMKKAFVAFEKSVKAYNSAK